MESVKLRKVDGFAGERMRAIAQVLDPSILDERMARSLVFLPRLPHKDAGRYGRFIHIAVELPAWAEFGVGLDMVCTIASRAMKSE